MTANNISFIKYLRFLATGIVVASVIVMTLALVAAPAFAAVGSDDGSSSSVGSDDGSTGNNSAGSDDGSTGGSVGSDDGSTGGNSVGSDDGSTDDSDNPATPGEENNPGGNGRVSRGGGSSTSALVTVGDISFNETGGAVILSWTTSRPVESWVSVNGVRTNSASGISTTHYVSLSDLVTGRTYQVQAFAMSNGRLVSGSIRSIIPTFLSSIAGDIDSGTGTIGTPIAGDISTGTTATNTASSSVATGTDTTNSDLAATAFYAKPLTWILVILALIIIGIIIFFWKKEEDEDETTGTPHA